MIRIFSVFSHLKAVTKVDDDTKPMMATMRMLSLFSQSGMQRLPVTMQATRLSTRENTLKSKIFLIANHFYSTRENTLKTKIVLIANHFHSARENTLKTEFP